MYAGTAFLIEDLRQTAALPVFRRGEAKAALDGELSAPVQRASSEAGVRQPAVDQDSRAG